MSEPKPFASLSSGLLARKGAAKPAMRPQGYTHIGGSLDDLGWNDMGHSVPPPAEHVPSSISALTPLRPQLDPVDEPAEEFDEVSEEEIEDESAEQVTDEPAEPEFEPEPVAEAEDEPEEEPEELPHTEAVVRLEPIRQPQPEPIEEPFQEPAILDQQRALEEHYRPALRPSRPVQPRRPQTVSAGSKAAFTLRLDTDRHLKLRLACALTRRSAQQIVTEALDGFMNTLPEVEALAQQVPAKSGKRGR